ncbi:Solute carrier family 28 member 3, partial [Chelonia mydas]
CFFYRTDVTDIRMLVSLTVYLVIVIAACVLNFQRALALFVLTLLAIFFICWDSLMARHEDKIAEFFSPCERFLKRQWFWLKWVVWIALIAAIICWLIFDTARQGTNQLISFGGLVMYLLLTLIFSKYPTKIFLEYSDNGAKFVFGEKYTDHFFAFKVLPIVIFFSTVMSMLYHVGFMQWLIKKVGWIMQVTLGTSPVESLVAAGNIFVGQTESPLLVRPYLPYVTKSELHSIMTSGFATIAGSVLGAYISFGIICAYVFMPFSFMMGVDWEDSFIVGGLLGYKTFFNEFVAYERLSTLIHLREKGGPVYIDGVKQYMTIRSETIATYALCGFANFGSLGLVIGGLTSIAPSKRRDIADSAFRAMIAGTVACFMTACIAACSTPLQPSKMADIPVAAFPSLACKTTLSSKSTQVLWNSPSQHHSPAPAIVSVAPNDHIEKREKKKKKVVILAQAPSSYDPKMKCQEQSQRDLLDASQELPQCLYYLGEIHLIGGPLHYLSPERKSRVAQTA